MHDLLPFNFINSNLISVSINHKYCIYFLLHCMNCYIILNFHIFIALSVLGGVWELRVHGRSLGEPLGVPGRPCDVLWRIGVVLGGRGFCHRSLCHVYRGKYDVSVVSLGALTLIG